jgi:serine protease Do
MGDANMKLKNKWLLVLVAGILVGANIVFAEDSAATSEKTAAEVKTNVSAEKAEVARLRETLATMSKDDKLSPLFHTVAQAVRPSVVVIRVTKKIKVQERTFMFPGFGDLPPDVEEELKKRFGEDHPFLRRHREGRQQKERFFRQYGQGSGVIVDAENGYILTNNHVVDNMDKVKVILADKREFEAQWVRCDKGTDLAVVKIQADNLIASPLGDSDQARVGHWVLAIGAPFGLEQTVTSGIVSAKGRAELLARGAMMDPNKVYQEFIQTDAAINRGNSGGPLVNLRGEVIGVNTMIASNFGGYDGVGFAIPSNMVKIILKQLADNGAVQRGYLGIGIQDVNPDYAAALGLDNAEGGLVAQVQPDSAAAKAGLELEDVITAVNGRGVKNANELRNNIAACAPGSTVTLTVLRDGKTITIKATLGKNPNDETPATAPAAKEESKPRPIVALEKLGLSVQDLTAEAAEQLGYKEGVKGMLISSVEEDSAAWEKQLRVGMVITHVGKKPVGNVDELAAALAAAKGGFPLRITTPQGGGYFVFLKPKE